ncbi:uncharacterized protein LOC142608979 [Castanea sativa]|uniref:uncharacterized protein LOC142608979 n=1 Tax=Castanea sativa TaxID=21020 RepID=UPI003F649DA6
MVQNVQLNCRLPKLTWIDDLVINFTEEQELHHPHDDALVISLSIADFNTRRVLVNNESLADILYYLAFQQMRMSREWFIPIDILLVGFSGTKVLPVGSITLLVTIGTYPKKITKDVTFLVIDCSLANNVIIGQSMLNAWRATMSTYHLLLKFLTECWIGEAHGDQIAARERYITMLEMDKQLTTMNIEE